MDRHPLGTRQAFQYCNILLANCFEEYVMCPAACI